MRREWDFMRLLREGLEEPLLLSRRLKHVPVRRLERTTLCSCGQWFDDVWVIGNRGRRKVHTIEWLRRYRPNLMEETG